MINILTESTTSRDFHLPFVSEPNFNLRVLDPNKTEVVKTILDPVSFSECRILRVKRVNINYSDFPITIGGT